MLIICTVLRKIGKLEKPTVPSTAFRVKSNLSTGTGIWLNVHYCSMSRLHCSVLFCVQTALWSLFWSRLHCTLFFYVQTALFIAVFVQTALYIDFLCLDCIVHCCFSSRLHCSLLLCPDCTVHIAFLCPDCTVHCCFLSRLHCSLLFFCPDCPVHYCSMLRLRSWGQPLTCSLWTSPSRTCSWWWPM